MGSNPVDRPWCWVAKNVEDWNLPMEPPAGKPAAATEGSGLPPPAPRRSRLLRASLWLNLLLTVAVAVFFLLWWRSPGRGGTAGGSDVVLYSSYCVVFPVQGTVAEKVSGTLQELFPGKVTELRRTSREQERLLREQMEHSVRAAGEADRLKRLLADLAGRHSVRFKGYAPGEPGEGLTSVIERGGIFTTGAADAEHYGSLLQAGGLDRVLDQSGLAGQAEARTTLEGLRSAVADYASLKDALSIVGERTAYLVQIEPTAAGHADVRRQLLQRLEKPVFISRPTPALFDAVDPTADTGGGSAAYALQLDRRCYWRAVGQDDRKDMDPAGNTSGDRMKWVEFAPGKPITWRPVPVARTSGKTDAVASFDIAVVLAGDRVVVFRNQSVLVGDTRNAVLERSKTYLDKVLGLPVQPVEDAVSVQSQGGQFTGALRYSYLAEQVTPSRASTSRDMESMSLATFETVRVNEDRGNPIRR